MSWEGDREAVRRRRRSVRIASSSIWERRDVWRSAGVLKRGVRKRKAQRMVLSSWAEVREARRRARRMARRQSSWWENVKGESRFYQVVSWGIGT